MFELRREFKNSTENWISGVSSNIRSNVFNPLGKSILQIRAFCYIDEEGFIIL